jgi:hypothetical protein
MIKIWFCKYFINESLTLSTKEGIVNNSKLFQYYYMDRAKYKILFQEIG